MEKTDYDNKSVALHYDSFIHYSRRVDILKNVARIIPSRCKTILDLACGTGAFIDAIINRSNVKIVGLDISKPMLTIAKKRFADKKNVSFKTADFLKVNFRPSSFNLIVMSHAIRYVYLGKEEQFINKISRWLTKNGIFIVVRYESLKVPFIKPLLKKYFGNKKYVSSINSEDGLIRLLSRHFILKDIYKTGILFHNCVGYLPSRIKAYYFIKKDDKR